MKLALCEKCWDVFKLAKEMRQCKCGEVKGRYIDNMYAEVSENAVSIAIGNGSLENAIRDARNFKGNREDYYKDGNGRISHAWVRPNSGEGNPHTKIIQEDTPSH